MTTAFTLILTYILGGLTFVPLCIAAFLAFLFYTSPVVLHPPPPPSSSTKPNLTPQFSELKSKEVNEEDQEPVTVYRAGWITARRSYEPQLNGNSDGTYVGMLTSGYRSFMDNRSKDPRRSKPKDRFFAVLKQNILFLYESEEQQECWAAIEVSSHDVVVYPEGNVDGEFWVKRTAIELKPKARTEGEGKEKDESVVDKKEAATVEGQAEGLTYDPETGKPLPWFIFAKVNSDKEDWYHSLVVASRIGTPTCATETAKDRALFSSDDMSHLVDSIDSLPDSIPMRWFNALLGRIFLSVYRTSSLESYITSRIVRKLKRVKIPSMLSEIQVREVDVGSSTPLFSKPMLKELTPDGEASMECHVSYVGAVRITIETVATVSISSRFKPYSVRLVLAVVLEELEGTLLLKIKKPPSNRIWFGFTSMPKIKLAVEPVVSTRQLKWSLVTSPIESRIREVIAESIVVPHMDDLSFFSTLPFPATARGGIFGAALRKDRPGLNVPASSSDTISKGETDLMSLVEGGEEEGALEDEGSKEKAKEVEGVLISEGKETVERARQRVRRHSNSSIIEEEGGYPNPALEARSPTKKPSSIKSTNSAASTSVSSLAGLASARLASWREKKDEQYAGSSEEVKDKVAAEKKRSSSWFTKSNPASPAQPPSALVSTPSTSSLASLPQAPHPATKRQDSASSASTASSFLPLNETEHQSPALASTQQQEVSAAKLREILTQRAESRDRERKEKELAVIEAEQKLAEKEEVAESPRVSIPRPSVERQPSNLSLTAPSDIPASLPLISFDAASPSAASPVIPAQVPLPSSSPDLTATSSAPPLPNRPAWIKPTDLDLPTPVAPPTSLPPPPPPIRRSPSHNASASVDSPSSSASATTTASLLSSWRAKAADKEALAQSVLQAKESMRKWGAGWNARRTAGRPADAEGAGLMSETTSQKEEDQEDYRDYRKRTKSGIEDQASYYGPSESREASPPISPRRPSHTKSHSTASPSRMRASSTASTHSTLANATAHFDPVSSSSTTSLSAVQPQLNTSKPLPVPSPSTSPSKPPGMMGGSPAGGGYGYRPATMMQLPGIRDESRKKLVSEDHLGGGTAIVETKKEVETNGKDQAIDTPVTLAKSDITVVTAPASTVHQETESNKIAPPSLPPRQAEVSTPAPLPALPTRSEEVARALPVLPPRPNIEETQPVVSDATPPSLPPRSISPAPLETTTSPPRPTSSNDIENIADEAGWGIEEGKAEGEAPQ